jgi:hypothetical protein
MEPKDAAVRNLKSIKAIKKGQGMRQATQSLFLGTSAHNINKPQHGNSSTSRGAHERSPASPFLGLRWTLLLIII